MSLMIYNTLTKKKEPFKPLQNNLVRTYFCGPTVQDEPHIGHARAYIAFDIFLRYLMYLGYKVKYVRNITDIEDKIIQKANELGISPFEVAEVYSRAFYDICKELNLIPPNVEPRATGHIPEIIELIEKLIELGYAYVAPNGDVYFDVAKFKEYGKLSGQKIESLLAGARVEPGEYKRNPLDFALWKASKPNEPSWKSPWGRGRPGWHIECSAMSMKYLGETFDVHGGGHDLVFPHHENEIAQSEAATGKPFAKYWFHVGLVTVKKEKMSKSLGNIIPMKYVLSRYDAETVRFWVAQTHYRKPIDFSFEQLDASEKLLDRMYAVLFRAEYLIKNKKEESEQDISNIMEEFRQRFLSAMNDDLNTPKALVVLKDMVDYLSTHMNSMSKNQLELFIYSIRELGWVFGILQQSIEERIYEKKKRKKDYSKFLPQGYGDLGHVSEQLLQILIAVRDELRRQRNFDLADKIREELKKIGIILEDSKAGTHWKYIGT